MGIETNISLKIGLAVFITLTFAVGGLTAGTLLNESSVLAQNETGTNMTRASLRQPHRDYYKIIKKILQTVETRIGGYRSFELAFRCELTWEQFKNYRDLLINNKLLISSNIGSLQHYEITEKGLRYLKVFAEIEDDLGPLGR